MNANELADSMDGYRMHPKMLNKDLMEQEIKQAATMLRTIPALQAEIEALKSQSNPYKAITDTKIEQTVVSYTHPVELTNEEILEIGHQFGETELGKDVGILDFARAILRKAQEK